MATNVLCFFQPLVAATFIAFVCMQGPKRVSGFSTELIHRDSFGSPFYNPNLSRTDILERAVARSVNKPKGVTPNSIFADVFVKGTYLMKIRLGTPAVDIIGVVDTGSEIVWTQCSSCTQCVPHRMPLFDPEASSTYQRLQCGGQPPSACPPGSTCGTDGLCHYYVLYGDKSSWSGVYSKDIMILDDSMDPKGRQEMSLFFGCGIEHKGRMMNPESSGIFGLNPGPASLVSQLGEKGQNRLSYCLVPYTQSDAVSRIHFAEDAEVDRGPGMVTLSVVYSQKFHNYFVTLEAFTIGTTRVNYVGRSAGVVDGNTILDSGTTLTIVPKPFFEAIKSAVINELNRMPLPDGTHELLDLCFRNDWWFKYPKIVANFKEGDVLLNPFNMFADMGGGRICLMMTGDDLEGDNGHNIAIYGNIAQTDFLVGFDYDLKYIKIKPQRCAEADQ